MTDEPVKRDRIKSLINCEFCGPANEHKAGCPNAADTETVSAKPDPSERQQMVNDYYRSGGGLDEPDCNDWG